MHSIRRENVENAFKYLNEHTQTALSEHDFTIHNKRNSHNMKQIKKESDITFQFKC